MGIPIIGDVIDAVRDIVSEVVVDKDKKRELDVELTRIADEANKRTHEEALAQTEVNRTEASHRSVFIAGWRPFIGWVGGVGLAWAFVVAPFVEFGARLFGWEGQVPDVSVGELATLITGMLGMSAVRSYDKAVGSAVDTFKPRPQALASAEEGPPAETPWASEEA